MSSALLPGQERDVVKVMLRPDSDPADLQRADSTLWRAVERAAARAVQRELGDAAVNRWIRVDILAFTATAPATVLAQRSIQNGRFRA